MQELHDNEYRSLEQLNDAIAIGYDAFVAYEKEHPPSGSIQRFSDVGVVRILLGIIDKTYRQKKYNMSSEFLKYESLIRAKS